MSVSKILNLYACGIFGDDELVEAYNDICERMVIHGDVVDREDEEIFNKFIKEVCEIKFGVTLTPGTDDAVPSTSGLSTPNFVGGAVEPRVGFKHFTLIGEGEKEIKKFNAMAKAVIFKFKDGVDTGINPITWLEQAFNEVLQHILVDALPSDRVGRREAGRDLVQGRNQLDAKVILQSNANFFVADALRLHVDRVSLPTGMGKSRDRMTGVSYEEFCRRKTGILVIQNKYNFCLARALVAAMAWLTEDASVTPLLLPNSPVMLTKVLDLCTAAGVDLTDGGDRSHIHQFQEHLEKLCITRVSVAQTGWF
ncbi:hypothetical protein FQR65_LT14441 [Abscondita terminalis]|nr:hypothetical protein FQR65_LT14441 [Abscondita terminalis]